jgi:hypothetical protein
MPSASRPRPLAATPDNRRVLGDAQKHKTLARRAYLDAKHAAPLPT